MSNLKDEVFRLDPVTCQEDGCNGDVWYINEGSCEACFVIAYMKFRMVWDWPLTDAEIAGLMKRGNRKGRPEGYFRHDWRGRTPYKETDER